MNQFTATVAWAEAHPWKTVSAAAAFAVALALLLVWQTGHRRAPALPRPIVVQAPRASDALLSETGPRSGLKMALAASMLVIGFGFVARIVYREVKHQARQRSDFAATSVRQCVICHGNQMPHKEYPSRNTGRILIVLGILLAPVLIGIIILIYGFSLTGKWEGWWICSQCGNRVPMLTKDTPARF